MRVVPVITPIRCALKHRVPLLLGMFSIVFPINEVDVHPFTGMNYQTIHMNTRFSYVLHAT